MVEASRVVQLWEQWKKFKSEACREALLNAYVPLVKRIFSRLRVGLPNTVSAQLQQDLVQTGVLGLIQAFEKFDPHQGVEFGAFASFRIRGAMLDELRRQDWLSKNCRRRLKEIQRGFAEMDQRLGRHASDEEVAVHLGLSLAQLNQELLEIGPATLVFLEGLGNTETGSRWEDFIGDRTASSPEEQVHQQELLRQLARAIESLPVQERKVLTLLVYQHLGQKEIAQVFSVTPSRVSQIYAKAVLRLRSALVLSEEHSANS